MGDEMKDKTARGLAALVFGALDCAREADYDGYEEAWNALAELEERAAQAGFRR